MIPRHLPEIKALIFDLDGTAFPVMKNGVPSERVTQAVKKADSRIYVSVATGRTLHLCSSIISALGIVKPCIINGGTQLFDPDSRTYIWNQTLDPQTLREISGILKGIRYGVTDDTMLEPVTGIKFKVREGISKIVIFAVPENESLRLSSILTKIPGAEAHFMASWTPGLFDIHITSELATKKHAMQALLAHANLDHKNVMVVGDGGNDLPLFELAGLKVAMGNAEDRLKKAADWIAPAVEEDGLAVAIDTFILNRE